MPNALRTRTIPITLAIQKLVDHLARLFNDSFHLPGLPLVPSISRVGDGRGGTYLVCHLQIRYPNGLFSTSEGCGPDPFSALQRSYRRLVGLAPLCLAWPRR